MSPVTTSNHPPQQASSKEPRYRPRRKDNGESADVRPPQRLMFALMTARLSSAAYAVALVLLTVIYQFEDDKAAPKPVSHEEFVQLTGLARQAVHTAIDELAARHIVDVKRGIGQRPSMYRLRDESGWIAPMRRPRRGSGNLRQDQHCSPVDRTESSPVDRTTTQSGGPERSGPVDRNAMNSFKHSSSPLKEASKHSSDLTDEEVGAGETEPGREPFETPTTGPSTSPSSFPAERVNEVMAKVGSRVWRPIKGNGTVIALNDGTATVRWERGGNSAHKSSELTVQLGRGDEGAA